MRLNFNAIAQKLPPETLVWGGFNQPLTLDFRALTGDSDTNLESGVIEGIVKLLAAIYQAQAAVNEARNNSGLEPIDILNRSMQVDDLAGKVFLSYTVKAEINVTSALNDIVDPSEVRSEN